MRKNTNKSNTFLSKYILSILLMTIYSPTISAKYILKNNFENQFNQNNTDITQHLEYMLQRESDWKQGMFLTNEEIVEVMDELAILKQMALHEGDQNLKLELDEVSLFLLEAMPGRDKLKDKLKYLVEKSRNISGANEIDIPLALHQLIQKYPNDWQEGLFLKDKEINFIKSELEQINSAVIAKGFYDFSDEILKVLDKLSASMPNRSDIYKEIEILFNISKTIQ